MNHSYTKPLIATLFLVACSANPVETDTTLTPSQPQVSPTAAPIQSTDSPQSEQVAPGQSSSSPETTSPIPPNSPASPISEAPGETNEPSEAGTAPPLNGDISVSETTTFNGKVFDLNNAPLEDVHVVVTSLNAETPYSVEADTIGGTYSFNDAPAGIQLKITATKPGYTPRTRIEVLKSNKSGDPNANRYDFGTDGTSPFGTNNDALSDSPEVIAVSPGKGTSNQSQNAAFTLTFSEPMEKKSVENTFSVRVVNNVKLTVDEGATDNTFAGDNNLNTLTNPLIWDKEAFDIEWNGDGSEVSFVFKEGKFLPSDKNDQRLPEYQVQFNTTNGRDIIDSSGISRDKLHFRLTSGNLEESYKFTVKPDTTSPQVISINAQTNENSGAKGDAIQVSFSEPMIVYTRSRILAGGLEDRANIPGSEKKAPGPHPNANGNATAHNAAKNYIVNINRGGTTLFNGNWAELGGTVNYNASDPSFKSVWLLPPVQGTLSATVAGAPLNDETASVSALLENGTTKSLVTRAYKTQSQLTTDHVAAGANITNAQTETISVFYTDGSSEININLSNPAANTYTALRNSLGPITTNGVADWTLTELQSGGGAGNGNIEQNDRVNIALAANAQRNGKTIAHIALNGGIFSPTVLNMASYRVVTTPLNETLSVLNSGFDLTGGRFSIKETDATAGVGVWGAGDKYTLTLEDTPTSSQDNLTKVTIAQSGIFAASRLNAPSVGFVVSPKTAEGSNMNIYQPGDSISVIVSGTVTDPAGNTMDSSKNNAIGSAR